jgi:hypothetical protein
MYPAAEHVLNVGVARAIRAIRAGATGHDVRVALAAACYAAAHVERDLRERDPWRDT